MKISKLFKVTAIGIALMLPTSTMASASELTPQSKQSIAQLGSSDSYEFPSQIEGSDRYVGGNDAADNTIQPMAVTRPVRFIGRIDAHNAHKSGSEVSGHVSWTLISGARRKMGVKSTLKRKRDGSDIPPRRRPAWYRCGQAVAGGKLRLLGIDAMELRVQSGIPTGKGLHLELKNPGGITMVM